MGKVVCAVYKLPRLCGNSFAPFPACCPHIDHFKKQQLPPRINVNPKRQRQSHFSVVTRHLVQGNL